MLGLLGSGEPARFTGFDATRGMPAQRLGGVLILLGSLDHYPKADVPL